MVRGVAFAVLVALAVPVTVTAGAAPAAGAPLPGGWCGTGEVAADRPDTVAGNQVHVVYAYPAGAPDRFGEFVGRIVRDLAGVDEWWRSQDPLRTPRFDFAVFPGCDSEFGALDVSSVGVTSPDVGLDNEASGSAWRAVLGDLARNGLDDSTKKYLLYYDVPVASGLCGLSASNSKQGGASRVSFVFLQVPPGCEVGGWGSGNGWPARTAAHELLHAFNDSFVPGTAPNACEDLGHVCDSQADVLSTGTVHPSSRLSDAALDVKHDDYYDHPGTWWDIRDSTWLMHLETPPALLTVSVVDGARGSVVVAPGGVVCKDSCTRRFDAGVNAQLTAVPVAGSRLIRWEGACAGLAEVCNPAIPRSDTQVTAVFAPAIVVAGHVRGPGMIEVDDATCTDSCTFETVPGAQVRWRAVPTDRDARFVGWRGECAGTARVCTLSLMPGVRKPSVTAVFRYVDEHRPRREVLDI
jgi:hypothetical protein